MNSHRPHQRILVFVSLFLVLMAGLHGCGPRGPEAETSYRCPMHPSYVLDRPGDCPICGMRLVPMEVAAGAAMTPAFVCPMHPEETSDKSGRCSRCGMPLEPSGAALPGASPAPPVAPPAPGERRVIAYRNPMNPGITSAVPARDEMGMDYVPIYSDEVGGAAPVSGMAPVETTPESLRLLGARTAPARRERIGRAVRAVGMVTADERRIRHVHTKIAGWIEKLHVNFTGQLVRRGEPILDLYSPELLATQEEFLRVRAAASRFAASDIEEVRRGGAEMVSAARRRLLLFDVPETFVAELESRGTPRRSVTMLAPSTGYVSVKSTFEGQQVEPGQELFVVTDISSVWIEADVYEYEAPFVKLEQEATLRLADDPGVKLTGRVRYVSPFLSPETRTIKVRFEFDNPGLRLKPAMYADVTIDIDAGEAVVIPDTAVMDTGVRQVVFVAVGVGRFEPRMVRTGVQSGGRVQVLEGVREGEQVAVQANFLLDSESRLRSVLAGMATPEAVVPAKTAGAGQ